MKRETLCWDCERALGYCSWSKSFKPVKGWKATPTILNNYNGTTMSSYMVHDCPLFLGNIGQRVTTAQIAKLLKVTQPDICHISKESLSERLEKLGYKLTCVKNNKIYYYYLKKIRR